MLSISPWRNYGMFYANVIQHVSKGVTRVFSSEKNLIDLRAKGRLKPKIFSKRISKTITRQGGIELMFGILGAIGNRFEGIN